MLDPETWLLRNFMYYSHTRKVLYGVRAGSLAETLFPAEFTFKNFREIQFFALIFRDVEFDVLKPRVIPSARCVLSSAQLVRCHLTSNQSFELSRVNPTDSSHPLQKKGREWLER